MKRALALLAALSSAALAADHPEITAQGFSPDGRYHLLLTSWLQDGSGFPAAALQITDVKRNTIAYRRQQIWQQDGANQATLDTLVGRWRSAQAGVLARYGLSEPQPGERLFKVAPLPMLDYPSDQPSALNTAVGRLELSTRPLPSGCQYSDRPTRGFALTLAGRDLQRDTHLPASRGCASGYSLETAYRYKSALAVIVRVYSQGFEGPDVVPLVVTGQLK
ncbi:hypothetical protein DKM44_06380 [Deinococcus irradiatisoli]|uniref:DUF2259 domain-containing protein n=1 Tax=Deinococcus irradiatisoli TaxID=2202254 RepID=A0A2Z3JCZ0_9DEIO|nr:DUF2259 domain-containing protein [Deinococcus irradiatisoli]AWN22902.1 hypothetical protein DKM44_06380 [Deinococcus irradiatisoli]